MKKKMMMMMTMFERWATVSAIVLLQGVSGSAVFGVENSFQTDGARVRAQEGPESPPERDVESRVTELEAEVQRLSRELRDREVAPPDTFDDGSSELRVGIGSFRLGGLFQFWYVNTQLGQKEFRIRRAEIALIGQIIDSVGYTIMFDSSKQIVNSQDLIIGGGPVTVLTPRTDDKILQDAFLSVNLIPHHTIHLGQKHVPLSMDGLALAGELDFPERTILGGATVAGVRGYGDVRDIGVQVAGNWPSLHYTFGVFNGEGPNASDQNDRKDVGGRIVLTPTPWLHLGGSRYDGTTGEDNATRQRTGAEFAILGEQCFVKSEYGRGRDGSRRSDGWYAAGGYWIRGLNPFGLPIDMLTALRYEQFDPDLDVSGDTIRGPTAALSLLLAGNSAKFQVSYSHYELEAGDDDLLLAAFQVAF